MSAPAFELETVRRQIEEAAIVVVDTDQLVAYARNARTHSDYQVHLIAQSIKKWGFTNPVLIDGNGGIIAGHGRVLAAYKLGLTRVPCRVLGYLDEAQKQAYVLADNKLAEKAGWDFDMLKDELAEIESYGYDLADLGFEQEELESILAQDNPVDEGLTDPDAVPDVSENPVTKLGDVWILGKHRLMCGDSTKTEDVQRLMSSEKADMVFTDPPYGVNYEGGYFHSGNVNIKRKREKLANDDSASIYSKVIPIICQFVDGPCYTWYAASKATPLYEAIDQHGEFHAMIVWHKINATYAAMNAQYKQRHEPCAYWKPKGCTLRWCGPSDERTVWEEKRDAQNKFHPTQKPTCLAERAISNHTAETVLDLFGGSGSTLIACEKTRRKCYMMEMEEKYVQVIIERWQDFTGQEARLESTGETYNSLKEKAPNLGATLS